MTWNASREECDALARMGFAEFIAAYVIGEETAAPHECYEVPSHLLMLLQCVSQEEVEAVASDECLRAALVTTYKLAPDGKRSSATLLYLITALHTDDARAGEAP